MRERLIRLLQEAEGQAAYYDGDDAYGAAADYLIDNGVIVPPVKVGQMVYIIPNDESKLVITSVEWVLQDRSEVLVSAGWCQFNSDDIGKTVFLTLEAVEEALKARENNA